jgi:hypothetical protein
MATETEDDSSSVFVRDPGDPDDPDDPEPPELLDRESTSPFPTSTKGSASGAIAIATAAGSAAGVSESVSETKDSDALFPDDAFPRDRNEYPRRSFRRSFTPLTIDIKLDRLPRGVLGIWPGVPPPLFGSSSDTEPSPSAGLVASVKKPGGGVASSGESSLHWSTSTSPSRSLTCPSFPPGARPPRCIATTAAP